MLLKHWLQLQYPPLVWNWRTHFMFCITSSWAKMSCRYGPRNLPVLLVWRSSGIIGLLKCDPLIMYLPMLICWDDGCVTCIPGNWLIVSSWWSSWKIGFIWLFGQSSVAMLKFTFSTGTWPSPIKMANPLKE